jgi:ribonucleoside-diphosphate reductase alpha chain
MEPWQSTMSGLTENAKRVLEARYLRRGADGKIIENPGQLFERVARAVSEAELIHGTAVEAQLWEDRFCRALNSLDFLPNSPTLMNAGTTLNQLSACFVLPIEDSMESIFGTLRNMALVQQMGGGTGFSFSKLRPAGDMVSKTGGRASGPVSFIRIYDRATENIRQGGRRRGANMAVLRIDRPDIQEFINVKRDGASLRNFNLSVGVTDEFMSAVENNAAYDLRHPRDLRVIKQVYAKEVFQSICHAAWESGDPGLIFLDNIERANPTPHAGKLESTNPCGELPLLPNESCNLGSINLPHFINSSSDPKSMDWDRLREITHVAVRFLDDVITINDYPTAEVEKTTLSNRKIGLGIMGFAELCILLGVPYTSNEALALAGKIMRFIATEAQIISTRLAEERGVFPNWPLSLHAAVGRKLRNATLTSIAPTGTISIIGAPVRASSLFLLWRTGAGMSSAARHWLSSTLSCCVISNGMGWRDLKFLAHWRDTALSRSRCRCLNTCDGCSSQPWKCLQRTTCAFKPRSRSTLILPFLKLSTLPMTQRRRISLTSTALPTRLAQRVSPFSGMVRNAIRSSKSAWMNPLRSMSTLPSAIQAIAGYRNVAV